VHLRAQRPRPRELLHRRRRPPAPRHALGGLREREAYQRRVDGAIARRASLLRAGRASALRRDAGVRVHTWPFQGERVIIVLRANLLDTNSAEWKRGARETM
jgi:hypothetical protein